MNCEKKPIAICAAPFDDYASPDLVRCTLPEGHLSPHRANARVRCTLVAGHAGACVWMDAL